MAGNYYVYIMTNLSRTLYTGMTNHLERRIYQHKTKTVAGFTAQYNIDRLVYFESFSDAQAAISAEKRIKGWTRNKKIQLIKQENPLWVDLSSGWFPGEDSSLRSE